MQVIANILIALVAVIHLYIVVLEMFLRTTPRGQKAFGLTPNQGLYNGFLAALRAFGALGRSHGPLSGS